jgi:hypothetical protein
MFLPAFDSTMKSERPLKPTDSAIRACYSELEAYGRQRVLHEGAVSSAFEKLLADCARRRGWTLIPQLAAPGERRNVPDGTVRDENTIPRGYWEAKDSDDDLKAEIAKKIARGYPVANTIFEGHLTGNSRRQRLGGPWTLSTIQTGGRRPSPARRADGPEP